MNNLTKIASLPSGGGFMSALPPEKQTWALPRELSEEEKANMAKIQPCTVQKFTPLEIAMMAPKDWTPVYYKADLDKLPSEPNTPAEEAAKRLGFEPFELTERS